MFRFFVCINLILLYVSCQETSTFIIDFDASQTWQEETTEEPLLELSTSIDTSQSSQQETTEQSLELDTNSDASQSSQQETTEQPLELDTNSDTTQLWNETTTEEPLELSTNNDGTQIWGNFTTEGVSEESNYTTTTTTQQITSTMTTASSVTCPPSITPDILEAAKKEIIDTILLAISREITSKLEAIEELLSTFTCSNNRTSPPPLELDWQIYENLQIPLTGWLRVFDQPYSHKTRTEDLNQIAGICHNQVLVAATFNGSISVAAVGPARLLTLNTMWNQPQ